MEIYLVLRNENIVEAFVPPNLFIFKEFLLKWPEKKEDGEKEKKREEGNKEEEGTFIECIVSRK